MTNKSLKLNSTEQTILYKYSKYYNFIFKYSILVLFFLLSLIILNKQLSKTQKLNISKDFMIEKVKLIGEFDKLTKENTNNNDLDIKILQGSLEMSGSFIFSTDNLILHKNITMPKNIFLYDNTPIKNKKYFESGNYEIKDLENFAKNILFTNTNQIEKTKRIPVSLPLDKSIKNTFYLHCTKNIKLFNKTCNYYIKNFINTFFIYDLPRDYEGLKEIFNNLKKTEYKKPFCDGMNKYILYSNDTNQILEDIFISCGEKHFENFQTLQLFLNIQDQLTKGYINNITYQNKLLNNYKLISYQQILYNDIHENTVDSIRFETYTSYLENLLKDNNKIDPFYFDLTYRFNNNYIINILNKIKYKSSDKNKIEIENIISNLNKINNGNSLIGYDGLKTEIINKNLQNSNNFNIDNEIIFSEQNNINKLLQNIKTLSFFKIIKEKVSEDKIKLGGYFSVKTNEGYIPLYSSIILKDINRKLIVENIKTNEYQELNNTLQNIINIENYTISEVYKYIQENIDIFISSDKLSTCKFIENTVNNILEKGKNISSLEILECNPENISILKNEEVDEVKNKTYYKISMDNFNIKNIMISNIYIENEIKKYLLQINTNNITISNIIGKIISYEIEKKDDFQEGSNNILITIEDFEKYLNTIPNDIAEGKNKIVLEFSIQGNNFIGEYDPITKKLGPINFKYNKKNEDVEGNITDEDDLKFSNFILYLNEENQNKINSFLIKPIEFLEKVNSDSVIKYKELQYK